MSLLFKIEEKNDCVTEKIPNNTLNVGNGYIIKIDRAFLECVMDNLLKT